MKDKLWIGILVTVIVIAVAGYVLLSGNIFQPSETSPPTGELREFAMTAKQWEFNLTRLEVDLGDAVRLNITGLDDGIGDGHGFAIPDFNVNGVIREGQTVTIEFVADKKGIFTFRCSVFCGAGHGSMTGTLVVA